MVDWRVTCCCSAPDLELYCTHAPSRSIAVHVERTVLLQFKDEDNAVTFRVERWFMAADHRTESVIKAALVWDSDEKDVEQVVLMGTKEVRAVIGELTPFA